MRIIRLISDLCVVALPSAAVAAIAAADNFRFAFSNDADSSQLQFDSKRRAKSKFLLAHCVVDSLSAYASE